MHVIQSTPRFLLSAELQFSVGRKLRRIRKIDRDPIKYKQITSFRATYKVLQTRLTDAIKYSAKAQNKNETTIQSELLGELKKNHKSFIRFCKDSAEEIGKKFRIFSFGRILHW